MHFYSDRPETYVFSPCGTCEECCSGERFVLSPLILEDFQLVAEHFPIFFGILEKKLKVFMVFSDGRHHCPYLKLGKCSIYDSRPPACKTYPLSPFDGKVLCDTSCPSVIKKDDQNKGIAFLNNLGEVSENFCPERFSGFERKLERTEKWLRVVEPLLVQTNMEVRGIKLLKIEESKKIDLYTNIHLKSLSHVDIFEGLETGA